MPSHCVTHAPFGHRVSGTDEGFVLKSTPSSKIKLKADAHIIVMAYGLVLHMKIQKSKNRKAAQLLLSSPSWLHFQVRRF